jgi:hypothetical protein
MQRCQYTAIACGQRCRDMGVRPSMGSVGDAYDNAMGESFFATLECERLDRHHFPSQIEARLAVFDVIAGGTTRIDGTRRSATARHATTSARAVPSGRSGGHERALGVLDQLTTFRYREVMAKLGRPPGPHPRHHGAFVRFSDTEWGALVRAREAEHPVADRRPTPAEWIRDLAVAHASEVLGVDVTRAALRHSPGGVADWKRWRIARAVRRAAPRRRQPRTDTVKNRDP